MLSPTFSLGLSVLVEGGQPGAHRLLVRPPRFQNGNRRDGLRGGRGGSLSQAGEHGEGWGGGDACWSAASHTLLLLLHFQLGPQETELTQGGALQGAAAPCQRRGRGEDFAGLVQVAEQPLQVAELPPQHHRGAVVGFFE